MEGYRREWDRCLDCEHRDQSLLCIYHEYLSRGWVDSEISAIIDDFLTICVAPRSRR